MKESHFDEKQLSELNEILELARLTEEKLNEFSEESKKIALKWQLRAEAKCTAAHKHDP